jgi:hypothetical protein
MKQLLKTATAIQWHSQILASMAAGGQTSQQVAIHYLLAALEKDDSLVESGLLGPVKHTP